jgi:asparagine synthase (glutamine-hydrolysing)
VHTQLVTTPEALTEIQPLVNDRGTITLVADARIDNRDELRCALSVPLEHFRATSDAEFIVRAYERWGEECVGKLIGDFSFALWDDSEQKLFCARDRFGVRPFYYWYDASRGFVFGSEVKALMAVPGVPCSMNESCARSFLGDRVDDTTATFFTHIFSLPQANTLTIAAGRMVTRRYWSPDEHRELTLRNDSEYAEAFLEVFEESVRCRLRSNLPVGVALSGGIDSSSVAAVARSLCSASDTIRIFSAIYSEDPTADERPYVSSMLQMGGYDAHFTNVREISPLANLDDMLYHEDGPFVNPLFSGGWHFRQAVSQQSVRVLLDGHGGDNTLSYDFGYLADLTRQFRLVQLCREAKGLSKRYYENRLPAHQLAWKFGVRPVLGWMAGRRSAIPSLRAAHCQMVQHPLFGHDLELSNKANAAFQIEGRHPFLDARLVDFCVALPGNQRIRNGWTRFILRRALEGRLPRFVQWRGSKWTPNRYFAQNFLLLERARLTDFFDTHLRPREPLLETLGVDVAELRKSFQRYNGEGSVKDAYAIWAVVVFCRWLEYGSAAVGAGQRM